MGSLVISQNTKILIIGSLLIIFTGLEIVWSGVNNEDSSVSKQISQPVVKEESFATSSGTLEIEGQKALVTKVIDGDTFQIEGGKTVRFIGIDTPETKDPRRPVGCFGKEASEETKNLIEGKVVFLQKDVSETDKYGRLLRYVFLPLDNKQILFVDDYLIREGFAKILTYPPDVKYAERFLKAQMEAREANRGLWGRC